MFPLSCRLYSAPSSAMRVMFMSLGSSSAAFSMAVASTLRGTR